MSKRYMLKYKKKKLNYSSFLKHYLQRHLTNLQSQLSRTCPIIDISSQQPLYYNQMGFSL